MYSSVSDVAKRYTVGAHTVLAWIRNGDLKAIDVSRVGSMGRPRYKITEQALAEFEKRRSTAPTQNHNVNPPKHVAKFMAEVREYD